MLRAIWIQGGWIRKLLVFAAVTVIVIIIGLYLRRSKSVVYRFVEARVPSDRPVVSIFNPFRERQSERCTETFLDLMKAGQCEQAIAGLSTDSEYRQYLCEQERNTPLTTWNLKDREDHPQKVMMRYSVKRQNYGDMEGQLWVTVEQRGSQWQVTNYECWY